jgi:DNA-binding NtrC family response regulator
MSSPTAAHVLIVDDERSLCEYLAILLRREGFRPETAQSVEEALEILSRERFDLVLSDLMLGPRSGIELLEALRSRPERPRIIFMTAYGTVEKAVEAIRDGASDFILKPFANDTLAKAVHRALEGPASATSASPSAPAPCGGGRLETRLVGTSPRVSALRRMIERIARTESTVLVTGESGTGKEVVARAIHLLSARAAGPFLPIHCAALSESLLESELFGHVKGAFTGASTDKVGLLHSARGGTIFLDEIGEIPLSIQVKLLRVLQDRQVTPVGGVQSVPIDVRIVAATNADLEAMIRQGRFRKDLFYRLNVIRLKTPALRERREDLPDLARSLLARIARRLGGTAPGLDRSALERLQSHDWPGNIRELENVLERALVLGSGEAVLQQEDILLDEPSGEEARVERTAAQPTLAQMERAYIFQVLRECDGGRGEAAQRLGVAPAWLDVKLDQLESGALDA